MACAAVRQVVPIDRRHDDEAQSHLAGCARYPLGLQRIERERLSGRDVAETPRAGADVAHQEEGRRPPGEALSAVRATRFLADRREAVAAHHAFDGMQLREAHPLLADPL